MASELINHAKTYDEVIFIGRSGQGLKSYMEGVLDRRDARKDLKLRELPYSNNGRARTPRSRSGRCARILSITTCRPSIWSMAVSSSCSWTWFTRARALIRCSKSFTTGRRAWHRQGRAQGQFGVYGVYPARMLTVNNLMKINHASLGEGAPMQRTEERITQERSWRKVPKGSDYYAGQVFERQIFDKLCDYAHYLTKHPNRSFTPAKWADPHDQGETLNLGTHAGEAEYAEMYYPSKRGEKNRARS